MRGPPPAPARGADRPCPGGDAQRAARARSLAARGAPARSRRPLLQCHRPLAGQGGADRALREGADRHVVGAGLAVGVRVAGDRLDDEARGHAAGEAVARRGLWRRPDRGGRRRRCRWRPSRRRREKNGGTEVTVSFAPAGTSSCGCLPAAAATPVRRASDKHAIRTTNTALFMVPSKSGLRAPGPRGLERRRADSYERYRRLLPALNGRPSPMRRARRTRCPPASSAPAQPDRGRGVAPRGPAARALRASRGRGARATC